MSTKQQRQKERHARAQRGLEPCEVPGAPPASLIMQEPDELEVPARQVADDPAAPKYFRLSKLFQNADLPAASPTTATPTFEIARVKLALGQALLLTRWGQHLVPLRPGCMQAEIGDPTNFMVGTDVKVDWYLVAFNRKVGVGAFTATSTDPRGATPLYPENGTALIVAPARRPRTLNISLSGPMTVQFAFRFDAAGSDQPQDHLSAVGGFIEGFTYSSTRGIIGPKEQFIGRLAANAGGG